MPRLLGITLILSATATHALRQLEPRCVTIRSHLRASRTSSLTSRSHLRAPRTSAPLLSAADWAVLGSGADRASTVRALEQLKESGEAPLWNTFRLAPRPVSLRELTQMTQMDEKMLNPTADVRDLSGLLTKVLLGSTGLAFLWGLAVPDDTLRFTGMYLIGGIPIALVAVGSVAPGLLGLPLQLLQRTGEEYTERVCRHEAAHLLCAHLLGRPIAEVTVGDKPAVVVFDEQTVTAPGSLVSAADLPALSVVAMAGTVAEAIAYGNVLGAQQDLVLLQNLLTRCSPPVPAEKQQDATRYATLMAWTIIKKYEVQYEAAYQALKEGCDLKTVIAAIEGAAAPTEAKASAAAS